MYSKSKTSALGKFSTLRLFSVDGAISRFKALSLRLTFRRANTHPVGLNAYKAAQMGRNGTLRLNVEDLLP